MAGSLNHIISEEGKFTMGSIDNLGDAHEALDECFKIIYELADGDMAKISAACRKHGLPDPFKSQYGVPARPQMLLGGDDAL